MLIQEHNILLNIRAKNKESVLWELAKLAQQDCPQLDQDTLYRLLLEREQIGSTGVGNGVAIPHVRIENLDSILLFFGRTHDGVGYDSVDNQPVYFIVMIISPADKPAEYLETLGAVSRFLKQPEIRRELRLAHDAKEIKKIFQQFH